MIPVRQELMCGYRNEDMMNEKLSMMDRQELIDHYKEIKEIASRDSLTGLLNRGAMEKAITERLQKMTDTETCALFIVDLDNFKSVNDTLGHQVGDKVLIRTAQLLSGMFRSTDAVGRLGGDEFLVFLSGNVTEKLIRSKGQFICDQLQFVMGVGSDIVVTASVGVCLADKKTGDFSVLYHNADLALYKVKKNGKQSYCLTYGENEDTDHEDNTDTPINAVRLRSLLDYIDSGVAMIEMSKTMPFVYVSPAFARMLGSDSAELSDASVLDFIHPDERQAMEKLLREDAAKYDGSVSHVARVNAKSGSTMWWKFHAVRVEYSAGKPAVLVTVVDVSDLKEKESSLQMDNDVLRLAVNQTAQGIWEVDLETRIFRLMGENKSFPTELTEQNSFPEDLLKLGWISTESAESFCEFADEVLSGRTQGYGNFKVRYKDQNLFGWTSFSYRIVFDDNGNPVRAVGVIEGMNHDMADGKTQPKGVALPENLMASLVFQVSGDLTEDVVMQCWAEGQDKTKESSFETCTEVLEEEISRIAASDNGLNLGRALSRDALLTAYLERKNHWIMYEYQRKEQSGSVRWVSCVINLYADPDNKNIRFALWLNRLDKRQQWEERFDINIYKDPVSKLYTKSTVRKISTRLLQAREHKLCALVLVEIGGMARLYAQYSGSIDTRWRAITTALLLALGTSCVPGQFGTDRYVFFFPEISGEDALKRKLEQAFLFVRNITSDLVDGSLIRFMAGGVCRYQNETDYNILMKKAQELCQYWANSSGDHVVFADEVKEEGWKQLGKWADSDQIRIPQEEAVRPLSEREKDAAFHCILEMFNADSLEESARSVLRTLGEYYDADRTYILVPVEQGQIITMPHEWTSGQKKSIQQAVSGMVIEGFPLIEQCAKEDKPIFLTRKVSEEEKEANGETLWHFAIFPMRDAGMVQGYLCIENARNHVSDVTLSSLLSSCLLKERKKYLRNLQQTVNEDGIATRDLPNYSSYMEAIYTFNSDVYNTLGVICVDVPKLSSINSSKGFIYGRKLLWYVIQTIMEIFGSEMLYRTWDAEFVAMCPDTTKEIFRGKCTRLRAALTKRYPKEIRLGAAWSDRIFSGKALVNDAKIRMRCDSPSQVRILDISLPSALASYKNIGDMVKAGRFTIFFQPVFDMENRKAIAAEALIRGFDEMNRLIFPNEFINEFEKNGSVRDLDLFVLDYVMKCMDEWRKQGISLLPVSVNFSNVTLFDSRVRASILAIQSRYPQLDQGLISIEITETAGYARRQELLDTMEMLSESGMKFCLDNFNIKYANMAVFSNANFRTVKLDESFAFDITENENRQILVRDILNICQERNIHCVAKGVESKEQAAALKEIGCRYVQGYYCEKPLSAETFCEKYLK